MDRERKSAKRQLWRTAAVTAEDHDRIRAAALDTLSKAGIEPVIKTCKHDRCKPQYSTGEADNMATFAPRSKPMELKDCTLGDGRTIQIPDIFGRLRTVIQNSNGCQQEGLLRVAGNAAKIDRLLQELHAKQFSDEYLSRAPVDERQAFVLADVFKRLLDNRPNGFLCPFAPMFAAAYRLRLQAPEDPALVSRSNNLLLLVALVLPTPELHLFMFVADFCRKIVKHGKGNKLDFVGLARIFSPCMFHREDNVELNQELIAALTELLARHKELGEVLPSLQQVARAFSLEEVDGILRKTKKRHGRKSSLGAAISAVTSAVSHTVTGIGRRRASAAENAAAPFDSAGFGSLNSAFSSSSAPDPEHSRPAATSHAKRGPETEAGDAPALHPASLGKDGSPSKRSKSTDALGLASPSVMNAAAGSPRAKASPFKRAGMALNKLRKRRSNVGVAEEGGSTSALASLTPKASGFRREGPALASAPLVPLDLTTHRTRSGAIYSPTRQPATKLSALQQAIDAAATSTAPSKPAFLPVAEPVAKPVGNERRKHDSYRRPSKLSEAKSAQGTLPVPSAAAFEKENSGGTEPFDTEPDSAAVYSLRSSHEGALSGGKPVRRGNVVVSPRHRPRTSSPLTTHEERPSPRHLRSPLNPLAHNKAALEAGPRKPRASLGIQSLQDRFDQFALLEEEESLV